jgi:CBS domain-containing protein
MRAADIMTRRVVSIAPDASILNAARFMLQHHISGLPVVDAQNRLVGMVSEGDFLHRGETATQRHHPRWLQFLLGPGRLAEDYVRASGRKVADIMTRDVVTIGEDTPLDRIVELMERHRVKRLPVVTGDAVVGIVTRANVLHAVASLAHGAPPAAADDAAIRDALMAELERQDWAPLGTVNVVVRDGAVHLWGSILDERFRAAMRVAAENVPGVKAVHDHLVWLEPVSGMVIEPPPAAQAKAS